MTSRALCLVLLAAAACAETQKPATTPAPPPPPDKIAIARTMARIAAGAAGCYDRYRRRGTAPVRMNVADDGHVLAATVVGELAGSEQARCIEALARTLSFAPRGNAVTFTYPFIFN